MDTLNTLLSRIEGALEERPASLRGAALHETEKMYTHHALSISLGKLGGGAADDGMDGIQRARSLFERIAKAEY